MNSVIIHILILLKIFFLSNFILCQNDPLIEALDNPNVLIRQRALFRVQDEMLSQYASALEERIFVQSEPFMIEEYLNTLNIIRSEHLESLALEFIDFTDNFNEMEPPRDPLEAKVFATTVLFNVDNYSTSEFIFELLDRDWPLINITAYNLLEKVIINVPQYESTAKSKLINIIDNSENNEFRSYSISCLERNYGEEYLSKYVSLFQNDSYWVVRHKCIEYLIKYNYVELNPLLKTRLVTDPYWVLRNTIANTLLLVYGKPSDLKAVIDYQPNEPDETARSLMAYSITHFIPPKPEGLSYNDLFLRLISYTDELFQYSWIENEETRDYYAQILTETYKSIESTGEIGEACAIIDERILQQLEQDLAEELITIEGYKFLHYYTIYIKEGIEEEFGPCP